MRTPASLRALVRSAVWSTLAASLPACSASDAPAGDALAADPPPVATAATGLAALVRPFVGTHDAQSPDPVTAGTSGATYPGAALPFGMVQWSPDTPHAVPPGYRYEDDAIIGFSLTHLNGAGCPGFRDFPFSPAPGLPDWSTTRQMPFSHANEAASAGFYEVLLDSGVRVDLTATARTGYARFTFPEGPLGTVAIDAGPPHDRLGFRDFGAKVAGPDLVTGFRETGAFCGAPTPYRVYLAARFSRPFDRTGTIEADVTQAGGTEASGWGTGLWVGWDTSSRRVVEAKVGLSFVSAEGALANLDAESPGWGFDAVRGRAEAAWNERLGRVAIEGGSDEELATFETAMYHALLSPAVASDVDGRWKGFDGETKQLAPGEARYQNFSGWDVYRSWVQLAAIVAPEETGGLVASLLDAKDGCGALPRWSFASEESGAMVGDPSDATIASAWAFGARGFDPRRALDAMLVGATDPEAKCNRFPARPGLAALLASHYLPIESGVQGPPSTALEYAAADFAVARMAEAAGDAQAAADFDARAAWWKNGFDASYEVDGARGFVMPRHADGTFEEGSVSSTTHFVEGNATQYTFFVPHDVAGLVDALGGDEEAIARLDALFQELNAGVGRPHFYMGNEPQFGTPWQYAWAGAPWKTQAVVRRILREVFSAEPDGLPGNEDLGATSSWIVWAMLGAYPAVPGVGGLVLASPVFPKATVALGSGKTLVIEANGAAPDAPYVKAVRWNGAPLARPWITWEHLAEGGTLSFDMASEPDTTWGRDPSQRPPRTFGAAP